MKKTYLIILTIFLIGSINVQAQLKLGLKGGANFPSLNESNGTFNISNTTGWHAGGMLEIKLPIIGIEGDLIYSQTGATIDGLGELKTSTFDIPVLAKLYLLKIITIQAGPQFSFLTTSKLDGDDIKEQFDISNAKFVAGLGVEFGPFYAHGRFIFPSKTEFSQLGTEVKNSNIQLSGGWWLKK